MSAFEWYASVVISPPIPSNESWTLSEKVAGISQTACRQEPSLGGQEGRWTVLQQTIQYHAIHAGIMPRGGRYEAGHRLGSDRQQECRLPFASAVSSVLILTDAELDRGRSTVLHLTSNLPHSALSSVKFWESELTMQYCCLSNVAPQVYLPIYLFRVVWFYIQSVGDMPRSIGSNSR